MSLFLGGLDADFRSIEIVSDIDAGSSLLTVLVIVVEMVASDIRG